MTENVALHMVATQNGADALGRERIPGEEWLVTVADTESLPPQIGIVSLALRDPGCIVCAKLRTILLSRKFRLNNRIL